MSNVKQDLSRQSLLMPLPTAREMARWIATLRLAWIPLVLCGLAAIYMGFYFDRGWIPSDDGMLAHSAERVLQGELPHRDFDDVYTGGLAFLISWAFQLFGTQLTSIRMLLVPFSLAFVATVYYIAARQGPKWLAAVTAACCFVWSVPNYFTSMPSWYVLFLSAFGVLALLRFNETRQRRWLFLAGVCGGLGLLIKIVALYYIAAAMMFLMFRDQVDSAEHDGERNEGRSPAFMLFTAFMCTTMVFLVCALIRNDLGPMEVTHYVLPVSLLCGLMTWNEWSVGRGRFWRRFMHLTKSVCWLLGGILLPVACFLVPFVLGGALYDLYYGVLVLPQRRFQFGVDWGFQPFHTMLPAVLPSLVVLACCLPRPRLGTWGKRIVGLGLLCLAIVPLVSGGWYYWGLFALRGLLPALVLGICLVLVRESDDFNSAARQRLFLLAAMASMLSLIQYPAAVLVYFCYCAPLVILALHYFATASVNRWPSASVGLLVFFLLFGGLRMNSGYLTDPNNRIREHRHRLASERADLRLLKVEQTQYDAITKAVQEHSPPGSYIYAAPDCPEVYFLADRKNPTRTLYDYFDDPQDRVARILGLLELRGVDVVVINLKSLYADSMDVELAAALEQRYPHRLRIGNFDIGLKHSDSGVSRE